MSEPIDANGGRDDDSRARQVVLRRPVVLRRSAVLRRLIALAVVLLGLGLVCGGGIGGREMAQATAAGVLVAAVLQLLVARASLPRDGGSLERTSEGSVGTEAPVAMLQALAAAAAIRMFGGVIAVVLVLKLGRVDPLPFLAGFGGTYLALEIALARALIELERRLRPR